MSTLLFGAKSAFLPFCQAQTQPDLVYTSGRKLFWFLKHIPFPSAGVFWKNGLIYLTGLCPCWEEFWISPINSLWMSINQQTSSVDSEVSKPSACSGGAGAIREAADGKGRESSWLQKLNTKGPTGNLNKLIKPICFLSLFRDNCTAQNKGMTLTPVSRMMWM